MPARASAGKRELAVVVLAAGQGKRMRSSRAKVLHEVAGTPMLMHVLAAARALSPSRTVVVVGHQADAVAATVGSDVRCVMQREQLGTGHAVAQARPALRGFAGDVMVLCGDVPLITTKTLRSLLSRHRRKEALVTVLSASVDQPDGYGRVLRGVEGSLRIVEHADASEAERAVAEVNTGLYCFDARFLLRSLGSLGRDNAQGEYYLTDLVEKASAKLAAQCVELEDASEAVGINSRFDLAVAEALMQDRLLTRWMERGVTFLDPGATYLSADAAIGRDTVIGPNLRIEGKTTIGPDCVLEGASHLRDTVVGRGVLVRWGVVADRARIGAGVKIGPYAHLRPEADLGAGVHIGNFVEVKKSRLGRGSKANHLAYIGDATVGVDTNIGAGTITCNYDGVNKHPTVIGNRVQIGSDTQLVAPVTVGDDAYVAAGSTITSDVQPGALAFNDKRQKTREGWVRGFRARTARARKKGD